MLSEICRIVRFYIRLTMASFLLRPGTIVLLTSEDVIVESLEASELWQRINKSRYMVRVTMYVTARRLKRDYPKIGWRMASGAGG